MDDHEVTFMAVQQDASSVAVDWQVLHDWDTRSVRFEGSIFVLNPQGAQLAAARWSAPTDQAADAALTDLHMERLTPWAHDAFGRRIATVADKPEAAQPIPIQVRRSV